MYGVDRHGYLDPLQHVLRQNATFGHDQHLALAWNYLQVTDQSEAELLMCSAIQHVASMHGTPEKYHETLTIAWTKLVGFHVRSKNHSTFNEFIADNPELLNRQLLGHFFSDELIGGTSARHTWVDPDLSPIPS
jgi:hypothetical protein